MPGRTSSTFNRFAGATSSMQEMVPAPGKPRQFLERLATFQPAITTATGSIFGALLVVFFSVLYSHQIFFSDRWDTSATKYIELWFFTLAISVLVPALLRFVNEGILAWYRRAFSIVAAVVLVMLVASSWPTFITETAYTAIGYMFRNNIIPFQIALHLSASVVACAFLQLAAVHRDKKEFAFKNVSTMVLGTLVLGAAMSACAALFQYPGLHAVLVTAATSVIVLVVAGLVPDIIRGPRQGLAGSKGMLSERDAPYQRGGVARAFIFTAATIAALLLSLAYAPEKSWETIAVVIPIAYPLVEVVACITYYVWSVTSKRTDAIRGYGDVARSIVALFFAMFGIVLALLVSGYYRAILGTMPWLAGAAACGYLIGHVTRGGGSASSSARALQNHVVLLAGLAIIAMVAIIAGLDWLDHASFLESIPEDLRDPSMVPFPGLLGVIPAGLGVGLLLACAIHGIGDYHQKAPLGSSGEPTWNANATTWLLLIVPAAFYMGQLYFDNRIFEWYAHVQTNVEDTGTTALLVGAVFAIAAIALGPIVIRLVVNVAREKGKGLMQVSKGLPWKERWAGVVVIALVLVANLGGAAIASVWPHAEPAHHALLVQNDDFLLWSVYPSEKVADTYKPGRFSTTATGITVTMAAGETERVHLVLTPRAGITQLRVNISRLHDPVSGEYFPADGS
nr:hypothetical protein [Candidatus Sigynarchaeum springense]